MFALGLYSCRLVHHHLTTKMSARPMVLSSRTKPLSFAIRVEEEDAEPAAASMPDAQQPSVLPAGASAPSIVKPTASEPVATHATYKGKRLSKENITAADGYEKAETLVDSMIEKGEVVAVMPFGWAVDNAASQLAGAEAERQLRQALKEIAALRAEIAALKEENAALQEESLKELKADLDEQEVDAAAGALVGDVIAAAVKEVHDDKIDASAELLACGAISGALEELKMEQVDAAAGLLADGAIAAALEDIKMQEVDAAAGLLADGAIADAVKELQEAAAAAAAAITAVKEEEKKEEPVRLLLPVDAAEAKDQSSPKVSAGVLSSFKPAAAAGRLLRHSLSIEDVPEPIPTIVHEQSWVAENINWHEEVAVGGVVVRTPPGLRRMVSSSSSAGSSFNVGGSSGGLESQVSLSPESSEMSIKSSSSSTLGSLGRRGSSSCSSDDLGDFWSGPDAKQVGRSFSWTEKLIKRPDPVPDRFLPVSQARPTMVSRGAGEARAQSLAAAARESSSIIRAMKSEAAAAARARAAAAAAARKQPSSATQQRRARKAATN